MKKVTQPWSIQTLEELHALIDFPEYQREPNIWSRSAKQRLIDSMIRQFDIGSIYLYSHTDRSIDCVDGRQRIGAIMSFLGRNPSDEDNGFEFKYTNEIFHDEALPYSSLQGLTIDTLRERAANDETASRFLKEFQEYVITVVELSNSGRPEEFNLQFTRLNVGSIINSGEKLNAMVGQLRDACFAEGSLGQHAFLEANKIPTRRYAKEQTAAQILSQIFSFAKNVEYTRTRHFDMQRLFKEHARLDGIHNQWIAKTRELFDLLAPAFQDPGVLRNRAITVSTVLLAWTENVGTPEQASSLARFVEEFVCRLQWQVKKGLDVANEYRYLIDFQRHVTQASVEKPAVEARAKTLGEEFARWRQESKLQGDEAYHQRTGENPIEECRRM